MNVPRDVEEPTDPFAGAPDPGRDIGEVGLSDPPRQNQSYRFAARATFFGLLAILTLAWASFLLWLFGRLLRAW